MTNPKRIDLDSNLNLKIVIVTIIFALMLFASYLWFKTPDLFLYFNQAFCAH